MHATQKHNLHCYPLNFIFFKKYFMSFITRNLFYSTVFFNYLCCSSSKFILYINYHTYFIIFITTNFFPPIPILTTILYFILIYISIIFYFSLCNNNKQNKICESQFLKINKTFPFYFPFPLFPFFFFFFLSFLLSFFSLLPYLFPVALALTIHSVSLSRCY
jgi:hypothetical protein